MANLAINNGGVSTNKGGLPSIDLRYGPYASVADAYAQLGPDGDDVITPGLTVGILSGNVVTEYWFKGGVDQAHLVPKQPNWSDINGKPADLVQDAQYVHTDNNYSDEDKANLMKVDKKQDTLVPGTNIKTVNGQSLLGAGNLEVTGKSAYEVYVDNLPAGETPLSEAEWLESLKGETGSTGHNPCLGRYNMFPDPAPEAVAGDYLFVDDTTESPVVTYVYKYDGTAWDSGAVVVTSETGTDTGTETQIVTEEVNLSSGLNYGQISTATENAVFQNYSNVSHKLVPVAGYKKVIFTTKSDGKSSTVYAFLASDTLVNGQQVTFAPGETRVKGISADGADHELDIPTGTTHLYIYMSGAGDGEYRYTPAKVQLVKKVTTTISHNVKKTMPIVLRRMFFEQGRYTGKDSYIEDQTVVTSGIVQGGRGFVLELKSSYVVRAVHMTDLKGNIVRYDYFPPDTQGIWGGKTGTNYYGNMMIPPQYGALIEVKRVDGGNVGSGDAIVESFEYMDSPKLTKDTSNPAYDKVHYRLRQMCHLIYTPLRDIPMTSSSWDSTHQGKFQIAGELMQGPPYSDVGLLKKYVGQHVSFYTFLTAVHNPLSLLYTEKVGDKVSHYGIDYTGTTSKTISYTYFGSVCDAFVQYVAGMPQIETVGWLRVINGMTDVPNPTFDNLALFDFLWTSSHVYMVTDIISEGEERKYVVISEMGRPSSSSIPYTRETITHRLTSSTSEVKAWRWNGWENVPAAEATPFINQGMDDYEDAIDYNEDICTFAGDKATFGVGDKIYLNIRRDGKYTSVKLSNEDGSFVETIPISELAADTSLTPNSRDWVSLNLTTYNLAAGLYNACALDAEGNASGYTYFEVLDVQLSVEGSGNNYTANFSSSNGQCYLVEGENVGGFPGNYYIDGLEDGSVAVTLTSSTRYIRVFARGQYGVATKRVYVDA